MRLVIRGGGWIDNDWYVRVAHEGRGTEEGFGSDVGFRLVLIPPEHYASWGSHAGFRMVLK